MGASSGPPSPASVLAVPPPWEVRYPDASDLTLGDSTAAVSAASSPFTFTERFSVPTGRTLWIRSLSLVVSGLMLSSDIRWSLLRSGTPILGWSGIRVPPRNAGSVSLDFGPGETYVSVPGDLELQVQVRVLDAGTYPMSWSLHAWHHPYITETTYQSAIRGGA